MAAVLSKAGRADSSARTLEQGQIPVLAFLSVFVQLGVLTLVLRQFQIEGPSFLRLWLLTLAGFAVHAFLPLRLRLPFFLIVSLAGIALVLGLSNAAWLICLGLVLIAMCHLPIGFRARVALLLGTGAVLIAQRAHWLAGPWPEAIWPILGSMFMFRLIVYLYDLSHDKSPVSAVRTLSYFFMLPNVCFPLFPVVDYKTFRRNYYDDDAYRIYQVGVDWIVRGVVHLLLYRVVYYYMTLAPAEVDGPGDMAQYLVSNFLLYLRVSGTFHIIVGMLYLFGFRLPETHHRYLFASSFTDFWRRINIYWKDFMLKIFYYPAYFRLRRFGNTAALVLATIFVFLMTWFLHAYQWFWLRGTILFVWQDILFWTVLGVLVVVNSLWEASRGRERSLRRPAWTYRGVSILTLKIAAMFSFICVLWSFWTAESIREWLSLWKAIASSMTTGAGGAPLLVAVLLIGGIAVRGTGNAGPQQARAKPSGKRQVIATVLTLALLVPLGIEPIYTRLGPTVASVIQPLRSGNLSRLDQAALDRGYYENLMQVNRFNSQLWEVYSKRPANWLDIESGAMKRHVGGFAQVELIPSFVSSTRYGTITTNRWGMRDQDYDLSPPAGAFRIAMLGPSNVMGWGVGDGQTFEALLERRLNREEAGKSFVRYEILNLGVPGYDPPQQLVALERALSFSPNAIFYVAPGRELSRAARYLVGVVNKRIEIPYPALRDIVEKAGLSADLDETTALRRIAPYQSETLMAVYTAIVEQSRARGIAPVWIFLPQVRGGAWQEETPEMLRIAREAGFAIIDLGDIYEGVEPASVRLAEWDEHPNVRGHELIAKRLYQELRTKSELLFAINHPTR